MRHLLFLICLGLTTSLIAQPFNTPLHIPDTLSGTVFDLDVQISSMQFLPGDSTVTYGVNADYLGPTLLINSGDFIQLNVTNNLTESTTMHWHGMHVAPEDDGGPHTIIESGATWSPDFTVLDEATTFWYHPHLHHKTAEHVTYGAAGLIIVREEGGVHDQLPHTYGVDDFPLIIQDKTFDDDNQLELSILADTMMVNGTLSPYLEVPAQMVRFRLLNASNQRVYNVGFPPSFDAWQIGSDGGLLEQRVPMSRVLLAPGERAEMIVDFSADTNFVGTVRAYNSEMDDGISGAPGGPGGGAGNPLDGEDFEILELRVVPQTQNAITSIPLNLNTVSFPDESEADVFRTKEFTVDTSGFPFYINGALMDMDVINDTVYLDDIEVWTLINNTDVAHPWHIHDVQFQILDINGNPPPPQLAGRKDVVLLLPNDTIRYITQFEDFTDEDIPYMFHCHNLFHEDGGMMGQFIVIEKDTTTGITAVKWTDSEFKLFPNPVFTEVNLYVDNRSGAEIKEIDIYDVQGRKLMSEQGSDHYSKLDVSILMPGWYSVSVKLSDGQVEHGSFIKSD